MIDWSMIVLSLQNKGFSCEKLAGQLGSCPVHLRRIARGEVIQPKFDVGIKLLDLHSDLCPGSHKNLVL